MTTLATKDDRFKTGRTGVVFRPAWKFPKQAEAFLRGLLKDAPGPVLHVCSGSSPLGDVRADKYHPAPDVRADMFALPFRDGAFGTTIADPPFPLDGMTLPQRLAQFNEMGRVTRPGGLVILHAPWLPRPTWAVSEGVWWRDVGGHAFPMAPVMVSVWRITADPALRDLEAARRGRAEA